MPDKEGVLAELERLLALPSFVRSPVQARLLKFLVDATLEDRHATLNSYTVAVEGLGRGSDYDPQVDSYARVQVARLRRALEAIYGPDHHSGAARLVITPGSYEVQWFPGDDSHADGADSADTSHYFILKLTKKSIYAISFALLAIVTFSISALEYNFLKNRSNILWDKNNFPSIYVSFIGDNYDNSSVYTSDNLRDSLSYYIQDYQSIRLVDKGKINSDFIIEVYREGGEERFIKIVSQKDDRVIWSENLEANDLQEGSISPEMIFRIAGLSGFIHSYNRQKTFDRNTPYGCWLDFTATIQSSVSISDNDGLQDCAEDWYEHTPEQPLAAAIYGWVLSSAATLEPIEAERVRKLGQAIEILRVANDLNPESPILRISLMRALAFDGQREAMRLAAHDAVRMSGSNLDIQGLAGVFLTFQDFPEGDDLTHATIEKHGNPPAWYFIGRMIAAMMREDVPAARRHLVQLQPLKHSLPVVSILTAALEARTGNMKEARRAWAQAEEKQPMLRWNPDLVFRRLPLAPSVRTKLKSWLQPVLH